jgi:carboxypeptidase C (cathepsin A)
MKFLYYISVVLALTLAAKQNDLITKDLPGCSSWNFKAYSGYIPVDDHNEYHYVFLESQNEPSLDPLIVSFSGGPGCSAMNTLFQETGPCTFYGYDENPLPHDNIYSWNKNASVLYVESPTGVGFNIGYQGEQNSDDRSAELHTNFLVNWFEEFSEFQNNDMYLNGESYVGVYVPMLTVTLHQKNLTTNSGGYINLKGIMVGNPMTDWDVDTIPAYVEMAWYHGLIPFSLKESIDKNNCTYRGFDQPPLSKVCQENLDLFSNYTRWIDPLDIYRKYGDGFSSATSPSKLFSKLFSTTYSAYLNRKDVFEALNIAKSVKEFSPCSDVNYEYSEKASVWAYPLIKEYGYRVMVYSGDTDAVVTTVGTWKWVEKLGWRRTQPQKQWIIDDKVVGFFHRFDGLDFLIFHGAGHLVPIWMKKESQIAIYKWINQEEFP